MWKYPARRRAVIATVKSVRRQAKLSQRALSKRLGEPHNYCHMVEAGKYNLPVDEFMAWCEECGASPSAAIDDVKHSVPRARRMPVRDTVLAHKRPRKTAKGRR